MTILTIDESRTLAEWLRLLAQPQRLMILSLLLDGSHAVSEIEAVTGIGQPTLSQHLGTLRRAGLIESRRESRTIHYGLAETTHAARARALILMMRNGAEIPHTPSPPAPERPRRPAEGARFAQLLPRTPRH